MGELCSRKKTKRGHCVWNRFSTFFLPNVPGTSSLAAGLSEVLDNSHIQSIVWNRSAPHTRRTDDRNWDAN